MAMALLVSFVLSTLLVPVLAASDRRPMRGLRRALLGSLVMNTTYLAAWRLIYPHLL